MIALKAPLHTLDPVRWSVYADFLEDTGASEHQVERVRRVVRALALRPQPRLVLVQRGDDGLGFMRTPDRDLHKGWRVFTSETDWVFQWRPLAFWLGRSPQGPEAIMACAAHPWNFPGMRKHRPDLVRQWFMRVGALFGREGR